MMNPKMQFTASEPLVNHSARSFVSFEDAFQLDAIFSASFNRLIAISISGVKIENDLIKLVLCDMLAHKLMQRRKCIDGSINPLVGEDVLTKSSTILTVFTVNSGLCVENLFWRRPHLCSQNADPTREVG